MEHLREQWRRLAKQQDGDERPFGRYTLRYHQEDQGESKPRHVIQCLDGGTKVGELNWYGTTGTIHHIEVADGYMRQGIATAMWDWGQEMSPKPKHSGDRTNQGDAWARSVGGPIPRRNAALSLESIISVAEQTMERSGNAGKTIMMPDGHYDDPEFQARLAPLVEWVRNLTGNSSIRFYASEYQLKQSGNAQAMTDGYNSIVVRLKTNEMTVLHEVAHVRLRSAEGSRGHTPEFARLLRDLYATHISQKAADVFWGIVGEYVSEA